MNNKALVLLVFFCFPLLFINVKDSHDWGDDFAQYFLQARNVIEHRPQTDNGLVFDQQEDQYQSALKAYPVGFPLMLASVWEIHGYSIKAFSILISLLMIGFAALTFFYLKKSLSSFLSFVLVIAFVYNPVMLDFKKQILSDIPFSFFLLLPLLLFQVENKSRWQGILVGVLFGWAMSIRGIGIILFIALPIWMVVTAKTEGNRRKQYSDFILALTSGGIFYLFLNSVLFPISSNSFFGFYAQAFKEERVLSMIHDNLVYYYEVLKYFFGQGEGFWFRVSSVTRYILIYGFLAGMIISWVKKFAFDDLVFILYVAIILIYPYQAGGFRFLIPIIPFLLKYAGVGIKKVLEIVKLPSTQLITVLIIVLVCFQNVQGAREIIRNQNTVEKGPQSPSSTATLEYVRNNIPDSAIIAFAKPRALSFYTNKKSACFSRKISIGQMHGAMQRMNARYILINTVDPELHDPKLMDYVSFYKDDLKAIWQNDEFTIYGYN